MSASLRCAFCHDDLVEGGTGADERVECASCKTLLHWDCRALLAKCPTLGCHDATFIRGDRVAVMRPAFRSALERMKRTGRPVETDTTDSEKASWHLPLTSGDGCYICRTPLFLVWTCFTCGTRTHVTCRLFSWGCPNENCGFVAKAPQPVDDPDPEKKRRAIDNLKKRPPRS